MKKLEISNEDLLKNWYHEDLIEALNSARDRSHEAWDANTSKMWADRADAYAAELDRRYKLNKAVK
jgi:hypothetical protein